jgi:hypothetical protein
MPGEELLMQAALGDICSPLTSLIDGVAGVITAIIGVITGICTLPTALVDSFCGQFNTFFASNLGIIGPICDSFMGSCFDSFAIVVWNTLCPCAVFEQCVFNLISPCSIPIPASMFGL